MIGGGGGGDVMMQPESRFSRRVDEPYGRRGSFVRGRAAKKTVQIVAVVGLGVAIAAVVLVATSRNRTDQYYDEVHFVCTACAHPFTMTAANVAAVRGAAGDPHKKMTCPKCKKETGEEATRCEKCGKWFPAKTSGDRVSLKCAHCGYDPDAAPPR